MSEGAPPPAKPRGPEGPRHTRKSPEEDHDLIHRMADGDESALAALYDRWGQRVHTIARWILGDADEAEDVVEETFWQAWHSAASFDGRRASGSTWLVLIARCRAIDRLRRQRNRAAWLAAPSTLDALFGGAVPDGTTRPAPTVESNDLDPALTLALAGLPADQREAVELAFFGGLSHPEIAARTAQPLGTVKTRIRLAMRKLRQELGFLREEGS